MGKICSRMETEIYADEGSRIMSPEEVRAMNEDYEMETRGGSRRSSKQGESENSSAGTRGRKSKRNHYETNKILNTVKKPK
mmetsp:Transcript_4463/g.4924  ORF Transcript_4463/g.4924 Transcript_4463/m.4924 type:complete len:81 (+) Transcript_4463:60-302(+)